MLRGLMMSAALCDCGDPEERRKMEISKALGIDFWSTLVTIKRPFTRYPFKAMTGDHTNGLSSAVYDLMADDNEWWIHFHRFIDNLLMTGLGCQFDITSCVTFKRDYMCYTNNINGVVPSIALLQSVPSGPWASVLERLLYKLIPAFNALASNDVPVGVLGSLEGQNTGKQEWWIFRKMHSLGLDTRVQFVTNSNGPGIKSPHLNSVQKCLNYKPHSYISLDGWTEGPSAREMAQIRDARIKKKDVALEYFSQKLSAKGGSHHYQSQRPDLAFIARNCGAAIVELGLK